MSSHGPLLPFRGELEILLAQREQSSELRALSDRVNGLSDRVGQVSRRLDRANGRMQDLERSTGEKLKALEAKVERLTEIAKWIGFAGLMLAGTWDKLPEPLRQRLLGG